jgi:REP element-mobilizing transposase RayT
MPRKPRVHYNGALFYVTCRFKNGESLLASKEEKVKYLELITHYKKQFDFKLYAWILMDDHIQLLVEVGHVPLSKIMQGIQQGYTNWYNRKNTHQGSVFDQRYKALPLNKDKYLLSLMRQIHQYPVKISRREGLDYPWSSHLGYIKGYRTDITDILEPLSLFSDQRDKSRGLYAAYIQASDLVFESLTPGDLEEGTKQGVELPIKKQLCTDSLETIMAHAAQIMDVSREVLLSNTKRPTVAKCRRLIILFCKAYTHYSQKDLSVALNMTESAISKALALEDNMTESLKSLEVLSGIQ